MQQKQRTSLLVGLLSVTTIAALTLLSNQQSIGSADITRQGCKINYNPSVGSSLQSDTLKVITRAQIAGTWLYRSIDTFHQGLGPRKGGIYTAAKLDKGEWIPLPLSSNDTMKIAENGPFFYSIAAINKKAWGRARVESCSLPLSATGYQIYHQRSDSTVQNSTFFGRFFGDTRREYLFSLFAQKVTRGKSNQIDPLRIKTNQTCRFSLSTTNSSLKTAHISPQAAAATAMAMVFLKVAHCGKDGFFNYRYT